VWPFHRNNAQAVRSREPYWLLRNGIGAAGAALDRSLECDVAVVGAGITGALVADALIETGLRIVVLDERDVAQGSTSASTALLQYEIDTQLGELARMLGADKAVRAYAACARSFSLLEKRMPELLQLSGYERRASLYLAADDSGVAELKIELAARQAMGLKVSWVDADELRRRFGCQRPGAILSELGAQVDPFRLARGIFAGAVRHGVKMFARSRVDALDEAGSVFRLRVGSHAVNAAHVVVCAGYESLRFLPPEMAEIHNTFALVTEPLDEPARATRLPLIWENASPYIYVRGTSDGRLIVGGEDVPFKSATAREALLPRQIRRLSDKYEKLFGEPLPRVAYTWAGSFAETEDGLPYIGAVPGMNPQLQFALCYGGNGITYSVHAGEMIRAGIEGQPHELDEIFGFERRHSGKGDIPNFQEKGTGLTSRSATPVQRA
jgi:glycine/D-amino acid oxidase-like deaminating enzyme